MNEKEAWNEYIRCRTTIYEAMDPQHISRNLISEANWMVRSQCFSGEDLGIKVRRGDICFVDFGQVYLNESGYQHFALVMALSNKKALVVPMTSNAVTYRKAYDEKDNPGGSMHLMRLGRLKGLRKPSVLFLNDVKFVNTARIIEVIGNISPRSQLFHQVQERLKDVLFPSKT
ncbi:MAG: type II toxin-antitoxin system PemK/MazF family toxin [Solobacterium sp.]|nr:type II toxin-antitoxin system PemK/MazF family toxin [Solobacterium sp.]